MNLKISNYNSVFLNMNRKERRRSKYSKKRKAAIAMLAAGLLALSSGGLSNEVIADATDDLVIYGGGSGGGIGASNSYGGGGGGYVGYGQAFVFGGGANGSPNAAYEGAQGDSGGGVGGGNSNFQAALSYPGGGNYLYDWGGNAPGSPGIGPNGITGSGNYGALPLTQGTIPIGTVNAEKGYNASGGNAGLSIISDISVKNIEVLAGDRSNIVNYVSSEYGNSLRGGNAVLDASSNKVTVTGDIIIASGRPGTFVDTISPISSGLADVIINNLYLPKGETQAEIFDGNNNLDVVFDTLTLADGAKFDGYFINSFEDLNINSIVFENSGTIVFSKNSGTFPSEENLLSIISTGNNDVVPEIVYSENEDAETLTITVGKSDTENEDKPSSDKESKKPSPTKIISPKTGDFENVLLWIIFGTLGIICIGCFRKLYRV